MQAVLRPMNLGEILDRTFAIYRKRFLLFVGIAALPAVVMLGLHVVDNIWLHFDRFLGFDAREMGENMARGWFRSYGYYHISGFLWAMFLPGFVRMASGSLFGERYSIWEAYRSIAKRWRTYLWANFLKICAQLVIPEVLAFGILFGSVAFFIKAGLMRGFSPFGVVFFALVGGVLTAFYWMGSSLAFAIPATALEDLSGWKGLRRSWTLTQGSRWRIFIAWMMAIACNLILQSVVGFVAWLVAYLAYGGHHRAGFNVGIYQLIVYFFYAVAGAVVGPLYPIAVTLLYYDQRVRKEGYDLEVMMEAAGLMTPVTAANEETASVPAPSIADA